MATITVRHTTESDDTLSPTGAAAWDGTTAHTVDFDPDGLTGPPGEVMTGPTGPTGVGLTGPTGANSTVPGPTGPTGVGLTGVPGATGPTGVGTTGAAGATGAGGPSAQFDRLTQTTIHFATTTTSTLASLTFPLVNGGVYTVRYSLPWKTGSTTAGIRIGLLFPAATVACFNVDFTNSADGAAYYLSGLINASGDSVVNTSAPTQNLDLACVVEGTIVAGGNGNLMVYAAGEVATASASAPRLVTGGNGICWRIA